MIESVDTANLHRRLKKIIGQVQAIDREIDGDISCEDVIAQLNSAKAALHRCGQVVLEGRIKGCVMDAIDDGDADKAVKGLKDAMGRFANMG